MKKKKLLLFCLLVIGLAIVLVSCGTAKVTRESNLNVLNEEQTDSIETAVLNSDETGIPLGLPASSNLHWHYQIGRAINNTDLTLLTESRFDNVQVIAIDTFDNPIESIQAVQYEYNSVDAVPTVIPAERQKNRRVICYVNVGAREDWRPDDHLFSTSEVDLGSFPGWAGEYLLDTRSTDLAEIEQQLGDNYTAALAETIRAERQLIRDILTLRFLLAKEKGCDAVEADNVDYWIFNQTDQYSPKERYDFAREYLHWIADTVHDGLSTEETARFYNWLNNEAVSYDFSSSNIGDASLQSQLNIELTAIKDRVKVAVEAGSGISIGLSIGLKNTVELLNTSKSENKDGARDLVAELVDKFDWAQNESCDDYNECNLYTSESSFIRPQVQKPVFWVQYKGRKNKLCQQEDNGTGGMSFLKASKSLTADVSQVIRCDVTVEPVDTTPPVISARYSIEASNGWYKEDVTVYFDCTDTSSVIQIGERLVDTEGVNPITSLGDCIDNADNVAQALEVEVKLDKTAPTVTISGETANTLTCNVTDDISGPVDAQPLLVKISETDLVTTYQCVGYDQAGNRGESELKEVDSPPPTLNETNFDFDNLDGWEKCYTNAKLPTLVEGPPSIAHFAGRKGGAVCIKTSVAIDANTVGSSYSLTCNAKRSLQGKAEIEVYLQGNRSAGTVLSIQTGNGSFQDYSLELENPNNLTKDVVIRIKAQRNKGKDADLFVDSCTLVANN